MNSKTNQEQMKVALEQIVQLANSVDELYYNCESSAAAEDPALRAARYLVNQIGAIADRCHEFSIYGIDRWILPPSFEWAQNKTSKGQS